MYIYCVDCVLVKHWVELHAGCWLAYCCFCLHPPSPPMLLTGDQLNPAASPTNALDSSASEDDDQASLISNPPSYRGDETNQSTNTSTHDLASASQSTRIHDSELSALARKITALSAALSDGSEEEEEVDVEHLSGHLPGHLHERYDTEDDIEELEEHYEERHLEIETEGSGAITHSCIVNLKWFVKYNVFEIEPVEYITVNLPVVLQPHLVISCFEEIEVSHAGSVNLISSVKP